MFSSEFISAASFVMSILYRSFCLLVRRKPIIEFLRRFLCCAAQKSLVCCIATIKENQSQQKEVAMYTDMMKQFNDQAQRMTQPMTRLNELAVESIERLAEFQLATLQSYSEMGVQQLKAATQIQDLEGMQKYAAGQVEAVKTVSKKVADDAKVLAEMGASFKTELEKMAQESQSAVAAAVKPATKKAPSKAA
ncbi:phasin family protein [Pelagibaculum spongiae]|uniref:Phasin family protein n=2 Tax=Pelagibaculum spongiae TaxID=2080658 RepID=A0A2V1H0M0_9GAMM|nr:phasin family protein [Pelagibaculum spongiae]